MHLNIKSLNLPTKIFNPIVEYVFNKVSS